ncbi:helix-turn-helix domain-containing protein [Inquilinus sp. CA228]|uniref:helix-turn-helix domain-containing protein n=1 Tax=Inquilinus sp. CA228 TaxID=3455609 RepID=UPI003F8D1435
MNSQTVGDRLRTAMKAAKVTGEMLSEQIDLSLSGIRKWTSGQTDPGFSHMARAAEALDLSLDWLATGEGPMWRRERPWAADQPLYQPNDRARPAHLHEAPAGYGWDPKLMRESIETIAELLDDLDREADPAALGDFIFELYELEMERKQDGQKVGAAEVLRILRKAG